VAGEIKNALTIKAERRYLECCALFWIRQGRRNAVACDSVWAGLESYRSVCPARQRAEDGRASALRSKGGLSFIAMGRSVRRIHSGSRRFGLRRGAQPPSASYPRMGSMRGSQPSQPSAWAQPGDHRRLYYSGSLAAKKATSTIPIVTWPIGEILSLPGLWRASHGLEVISPGSQSWRPSDFSCLRKRFQRFR
jgi:hypothetical protein